MSHTVHVYPALIKRATVNLERSKKFKSLMKKNGQTNLQQIDLEIMEQERILALLNKSRRDIQPDLFTLNTDLNHK